MTRHLLLLLSAAAVACARVPTFDEVAAQLPPMAPGDARIFVYRAFEPYQSLVWVPIFFSGVTVGAVGPGHVLYRDVPPGTYDIAAKSAGLYPNQDKVVVLAPGESVYAKVDSFIGEDPEADRARPLTTFVVVLVDPATARREIGGLWLSAWQKGPTVAGQALQLVERRGSSP